MNSPRQPYRGLRLQGGFSLLEVLVTLLVAGLALALASQVLLEAQRRVLVEERRALDPDVPLALAQLRADVTAAASGDASGGGLSLLQPSGRRIAWTLRDGELWRQTVEAGTGATGERLVLRGVVSFTAEVASGGLGSGSGLPLTEPKPVAVVALEVETVRSLGPEVAAGRRVVVPTRRERYALGLTLRGGGGENGW